MKYPGYDTGKVVLSEGIWYPFRIHKHVKLQDNEWYFILQDINGMKHFLPSGYYENYKMEPGDEISCLIDKINCTGRIILEPRHPYYHINKIYKFDIISFSKEGSISTVVLREIFGNSIEVPLCGNKKLITNGRKKVSCLVKSIKKGIPILEILSE